MAKLKLEDGLEIECTIEEAIEYMEKRNEKPREECEKGLLDLKNKNDVVKEELTDEEIENIIKEGREYLKDKIEYDTKSGINMLLDRAKDIVKSTKRPYEKKLRWTQQETITLLNNINNRPLLLKQFPNRTEMAIDAKIRDIRKGIFRGVQKKGKTININKERREKLSEMMKFVNHNAIEMYAKGHVTNIKEARQKAMALYRATHETKHKE